MNKNALKEKKISFLATGSEILFGDLQESNCYRFSKLVSQAGGQVYQHVHASDRKSEIVLAIDYLLSGSDAVIITGGLGPTSDDNTRFAVAEYTNQDLYFNEDVWEIIFQRLKSFNLPMSVSNRQQALFPQSAVLYPNKNGSAYGFHLKWKEKYIFVLPGPPKECTPLFEEYILPTLQAENFLAIKSIFYWKTLGLVESAIAAKVDELSKSYNVETGYRWHYPYLDIKIICDTNYCVKELSKKINVLLKPNLVSYDQKSAFEILECLIQNISSKISIVDCVTSGEFENNINHKKIEFIHSKTQDLNTDKILFIFESSKNLEEETEYSGIIQFKCTGLHNNYALYSHDISVPYRSKEVFDYAKHYAAWQLNQFIITLKNERKL